MKKMLFTLLAIALLAGPAFAQTGSITGTVADCLGNPVEEARVSLWGDGHCLGYVLTDDTGAFTLTDVAPGVYEVRAGKQQVGHATVEGVEVMDGQVANIGLMTLIGKQQHGVPAPLHR